jgi:RNAse (barnase) inhibitor barstar
MNEPPGDALALLEADPPVRVLRDEGSLPPEGGGEIRARIAGAGIAGEEELFSALAASLSFPDWFGRNWDALLDCLREVGVGDQRPAAVTLVVEDAGALLSRAPRTAAGLVETWLIAALWWAQRGVPFRLVLLIEA